MKSVLDKAFYILEIFLRTGDREMRLSDLARISGLNITTVNRVVAKLVAHSYLTQAENRGKYMLGPKFLEFNKIIEQTRIIKRVAMPYMIKLNKYVEDAVGIFTWDGKKLVFTDEIRSGYLPVISGNTHEVFPLYCTALGKIILAGMTGRELAVYLKETELEAYTTNTISDPDELRKHLKRVAQEGVAYDNEEYWPGIRNVASGVFDNEGKTVACIGVLGPAGRLSAERMAEIAPYVRECALEISQRLGYRDQSAPRPDDSREPSLN